MLQFSQQRNVTNCLSLWEARSILLRLWHSNMDWSANNIESLFLFPYESNLVNIPFLLRDPSNRKNRHSNIKNRKWEPHDDPHESEDFYLDSGTCLETTMYCMHSRTPLDIAA